MIKGAVPGSKGGWVTIKDAVKKAAPAGLPMPAAVRKAAAAAVIEAPAVEVTTEGGEA
jgi:large subunit ribosomal protein L3